MIDLPSLALVLGGTLLAALLQAGWTASRSCLAELAALLRRPFDAARTKADLARQIADLKRDGLVRARPQRIGDAEFQDLTEAMLAARSLEALIAGHAAQREARRFRAAAAQLVCLQAADLAPVLGLAGTLVALGRLGPPEAVGSALAAAIGMAVSTTLYGVVLANLVFLPLAGVIERRANAEDALREQVFGWLRAQAARTAPHLAPAAMPREAA